MTVIKSSVVLRQNVQTNKIIFRSRCFATTFQRKNNIFKILSILNIYFKFLKIFDSSRMLLQSLNIKNLSLMVSSVFDRFEGKITTDILVSVIFSISL